jgi:hypothetical protein
VSAPDIVPVLTNMFIRRQPRGSVLLRLREDPELGAHDGSCMILINSWQSFIFRLTTPRIYGVLFSSDS